MVVIKSQGLNKTYLSKGSRMNAVIDCSIEINAGECVAICGTKHSGKTTLLRLLGGLERPTSGDIFILDNNISLYGDDELAVFRRKAIGYLFRKDTLIPELNVYENIIIPSLLGHMRTSRGYQQDIIERLQLKELLSRYPKQLSLSENQRVLCARAVINDPDIILSDGAVDYYEGTADKDVLDFLLNMVYKQHKTLIIAADAPNISIFIDHIIKLKDGKVIEDLRVS